MSFSHILRAILGSSWAIHEDHLRLIIDVVDRRMRGERLADEEIAQIVAGRDEQAALDGRRVRAVAQKEGAVMVIPIYGVISNRAYMVQDISGPRGASAEILSNMFRQAMEDPDVKAIVLDVNSPGGTVGGIEELSSQIFNARGDKPIIAQVNSFCASAAYWLATAADEIVVTPTSEVGSIGVWSLHEDWSQNLEMEGIKPTLISAGKFKVEGNSFEPLGEEARAAIQSDVDAYYGMFVDAVARNRGVSAADVRKGFGEGRMVRAQEAIKINMADRIGTMNDTLSRLGVSPKNSGKKQAQTASRSASRERELEILNIKH